MSTRETSRRELCRKVLKFAHKVYKEGGRWFSFKACLKLAWKALRGIGGCFKYSRVRGISYTNPNNVSRQEIVRRLDRYPYEDIGLYFKRNRDNIYDSNAIMIFASVKGHEGSAMLGYLSREESKIVAPRMDAGCSVVVLFDKILGGGNLTYGISFRYALA